MLCTTVRIECSGNPSIILETITKHGYEQCVRCVEGEVRAVSTVNNNQYLSVMDISNIENLDDQDAQALAGVGVINQEDNRSATMVVRDHDMVCRQSTDDGLELISIADALKRYDWLKEKYYFKAVSADLDEVTQKCAAQEQQLGYFIHVKKGASVSLPCQAAMYMTTNDITQVIHNIVVLEEDSKLELITGCCSGHNVIDGNHLAVEELYVWQECQTEKHNGAFVGRKYHGFSAFRDHCRGKWTL